MQREMRETKIDSAKRAEYVTDEGKIYNEAGLAKEIVNFYAISTLHGVMYCSDGTLNNEKLAHDISELLIFMGVRKYVARETESVISLIRMLSYDQSIPLPAENEIPVANGTITVDTDGLHFTTEKRPSCYRLPVAYNPAAPRPAFFLDNYIAGLLHPEDIAGLQEFCGYCLVPTTKFQKALFLIGAGEEGKSVMGSIMLWVVGDAFVGMKLHALESDRFAVANTENKLLAYDDDMLNKKMENTAPFKTFVTAKTPIEGERKGLQKFQFLPFAKLFVNSNFPLSTLHDTSDAFFRRIFAIRVKNRPAKRVNISNYEAPMRDEIEGIFLWMLEGLVRLWRQDHFTISERSAELVQTTREEANSVVLFVEECIIFDPKLKITSDALYAAYAIWCAKYNKIKRGSPSVLNFFNERQELLKIRYAKKIEGNKRGFRGMGLKNNPNYDLDTLLDGGAK